MRVVIFLPSIETGGVERNAILVANYLAENEVPITFVSTRIVESMRSRFDNRVKLIFVKSARRVPLLHPRIVDAFAIFSGYRKVLEREKMLGSAVTLSFQSNIVSILAAKIAGVPVVVRVSNHPSHVKFTNSLIQKISEKLKLIFYRYADVVIANAEETAQFYRSRLPVTVSTIYNPVDSEALKAQAKHGELHPWLSNHDCPVVVGVGRLVRQKNFTMLIEAFGRVVEKIDAKLIILGEGDERDKLETLVSRLGLQNQINLPGYSKNVHGVVKNADLFVLSSSFEGLPNALLEALAVGTPAVSTNCLSGPAEILCHGAAGDLVAVDDVDAMAEAILRNLSDRDRAILLLRKAGERLKEFDQVKILKQYADLLGSLV